MGLGDVVDEFLNQDGLPDTCPPSPKKANLSTTSIRSKEVNLIPRAVSKT